MGTLASELGGVAERLADRPRIYADANVPAGLVAFMRERLRWDVFFVMEEPELRRAPDGEHFRMAVKLRRTLVTLDRDYLDDRRFPPSEGGGVLVLAAPDEPRLMQVLGRVHRALFQKAGTGESDALPLLGRKLHAQADWTGDAERPERVLGPRE
jgi:hypothetical protein